MRIALIATVLNERSSIEEFLTAVDAQTEAPDQIVIVDGGSSDGTLEFLRGWANDKPHAQIIESPGSNISRGRNLAIASANTELIAATDAGGYPESDWLEGLKSALEDSEADVAMGFYRGIAHTRFEQAQSCLNLPDPDEIDPRRFMPSSRSIAFRKSIWEAAGRYPEWLDIGEDMFFDLRVVEKSAHRVFVPDALVNWRLRSSLSRFFVQYYKYARGDGAAGMHPIRHMVRFLAYGVGGICLVLSIGEPVVLALPILGGSFWLWPAFKRVKNRVPRQRAVIYLALPFLNLAMDLAKMAGYIAGIKRRLTRGGPSLDDV